MKEDRYLADWLNNSMEESDRKLFESSAEFETYRKIRDYSALLTAPYIDMDATYAAIAEKRNITATKHKTIRLQPWIMRTAAVLIIALGLTFFFYTNHTTTQVADAGNRTQFLLPDNSAVVLNAGSEAAFKTWNWNKNRKLDLNGEAYFKVAKGQTFDVNTPLGKVTVVGTRFNVRARSNRFDVTCFEGKVKVTNNTTTLYLTKGQSASFEGGKAIAVPQVNNTKPGWIDYEAMFVKEKITNIVDELEMQYNVTIKLDNSAPAQAFTGTIPMDDLATALDIITTSYHLKAVKTGKNTFVLSQE
jgi:transmembrane sensor